MERPARETQDKTNRPTMTTRRDINQTMAINKEHLHTVPRRADAPGNKELAQTIHRDAFAQVKCSGDTQRIHRTDFFFGRPEHDEHIYPPVQEAFQTCVMSALYVFVFHALCPFHFRRTINLNLVAHKFWDGRLRVKGHPTDGYPPFWRNFLSRFLFSFARWRKRRAG